MIQPLLLWIDGLRQDLRYVMRQLARSPGFALVAVLTIGLGIAINATAFTFYDAVVLKPLPVRAPDELLRITQDSRGDANNLSFNVYEVLRGYAKTVTSVIATSGRETFAAVLPGHAKSDARLVTARFVSTDYFASLGVKLVVGRGFESRESRTAVVSHGFWEGALQADSSVLGQRLTIHGLDVTIVGIAPPLFAGTGIPAAAPDLWLPLDDEPALVGDGADWRTDSRGHWQVLARVAPHATLDEVKGELQVLGRAAPDSLGKAVTLLARRATFFQADAGEFDVFQQASAVFMAALALILAIAMVNLINLLVARNAAREREVTVRLALGASRRRVARQLAAEAVVLAIAGGAVGLVLSQLAAEWLRNWLHVTMTAVSRGLGDLFLDLALDWRIVAYAGGLSAIVGVCVGLGPAIRAARRDVSLLLRQGSTTTAGRRAWSARNLLLAVQVAGCIVLLSSAGVLLGGVQRARTVQTGFDSEHVLVLTLDASAALKDRAVVLHQISERIGGLSEVRGVAWTHRVPFLGTHTRSTLTPSGRVTVSIGEVSSAFFGVMGMPMLAGRTFYASEVDAHAPVVVVSQSLARDVWPGQNPVGKTLPLNSYLSGPDSMKRYTVVGVTKDVRSNFLSRADPPTEYFPQAIDDKLGSLLVRTRGAPTAAIRPILLAITQLSPTLTPQMHVGTLVDGPMAIQELMAEVPASVSLGLAFVGLLLAAVGVYGLISQIVTRRTREIGVHVALGARGGQVVALVLGKTMRPVAWGTAAGIAVALAVSAVLRSTISAGDIPDFTYGAGAFNPLVFGGVALTLGVVALAACYLPARRATRVDPSVAMRSE